eukprot:m.56387 g.56387  ORF g.56387 m.56387 type:complete len:212 (+) comp34591_c0_seq7:733-1368(+)
MHGHVDILKLLLSRGFHIDETYWNGLTALHHAALNEQVEIAEVLLSQGASMERRDSSGRTPFLLAAERGCVGVMKILMNSGCNVNAVASNGKGVLKLAPMDYYDEIHLLVLGSEKRDESKASGNIFHESFLEAFKAGEVGGLSKVIRARLHLVGKDRAGKTSVKNALVGVNFVENHTSTEGIATEVAVYSAEEWQSTGEPWHLVMGTLCSM